MIGTVRAEDLYGRFDLERSWPELTSTISASSSISANKRRIGAGHPHLAAKLCEFRMQRVASRRIEMGDDFVEQ